jgi:hypothetical protein
MRFWCWSIDLQSLCEFKCCLFRRTFVVDLSIAFSWLINLKLIQLFMLRRIRFSFKRSSWLTSSRRMFVAKREFEKFSFWKNSWSNERKSDSKKKEYSRNSKTIFSSRQLHRDLREYYAMNRKCQLDLLSTKVNFINRRFWAIDETRHRWKCLWCFDSFFQTFSFRHHDRFSLFRQKEEARRRLESYSFEKWIELESSRKEKRKEKEDEDEERKEKKEKKRKKKKNDTFVEQIVASNQLQMQIFVLVKKTSFRFVAKK